MNEKKAILIFGGGHLQQYLVANAKEKNLITIVIDPDENAFCKEKADVFRVVDGQDFDATVSIAKEFNVEGLVTSATDKPLVMMARVAKELNLPFYSIETAINSTDKLRMKEIFTANGIPCAKGIEVRNADDYYGNFPVIVKPRDNSGSRGVYFCNDKHQLKSVFDDVKNFTNKKTILIEEFVEGKEYSVESIHYGGEDKIIQITEKITTEFPYNVELGHIEPAELDEQTKNEVSNIIKKISEAFKFKNCVSHTEFKINAKGIKVIETSPRLGGDFITSHLVPLSTGINMEKLLINIALNSPLHNLNPTISKISAIHFFNFPQGIIQYCGDLSPINNVKGVVEFNFNLETGDTISLIKNSLDRYGYIIVQTDNRFEIKRIIDSVESMMKKCIYIKQSTYEE